MSNKQFRMSQRSVDILQQLYDSDCLVDELAKQMSLHPMVVIQRIAAARSALGVRTNIAAIRRALELGLIQ